MLGRDADARIDHVDRAVATAKRRAPTTTPPAGVTQRVGDQIAQDALEQHRDRCDREASSARKRGEARGGGLRREIRAAAREQGLQAQRGALRRERAGLEAATGRAIARTALRARRPTLHARRPAASAPARARAASAAANSPSACSGWRRSWLAAARNWLFARLAVSAAVRASSGRLRLRLEFADQVDVFVADRERARQHVVEVVPEAENEGEHHRHHERGVEVHRVAFQRDAHDQRHQRAAARSRRTKACRRR